MTDKSIANYQERVNTGLEIDSTASQLELERTPGVVAVSGEAAGRQGVKPLPSYPQTNSFNPLTNTCADNAWAILGQCQTDKHHIFAKQIFCGKEWCSVCGQKRSRSHNRKIVRVLPKAQRIASMGYFVIEYPDKYRKVVGWGYSKKALKIAGDRIIEVMAGKRMGRKGRVGGFFSRGLLRWHWFGDKLQGKWNPHANVLVDGAFIEDLEPIKVALRSALKCPDLIVHYSFAELPAQKFQRVEYITRPTFLKYEWSPYMASQLWGFRNQRWWGSWKDEPVWSVEADQEAKLLGADELEQGICPDCRGDLNWTKPFHATWLKVWGAVEMGETGLYRLPIENVPTDALSPIDMIQLDKLKELHIAHVQAIARERNIPWQNTLQEADYYGMAQN